MGEACSTHAASLLMLEENITKRNLRTVREDVNWIHLAQDKDQ
jgi:hypothetical protein